MGVGAFMPLTGRPVFRGPGGVRAPLARAASVEDAIAIGDAVILALMLDAIMELIPKLAYILDEKVVVDSSNPITFDEKGQMMRTLPQRQSAGSIVAALLPASAQYVKAFGSRSWTDG